jgi:hypothetical protein
MQAGRRMTVRVGVKNTGGATWPDRLTGHASGSGAGAVRMTYRWWRAGTNPSLVADYGSDRADLAAPLAPGAATVLTIDVEPSADPGRYLLQFDLVQDVVTWFEAKGAATLKTQVTVQRAEAVPTAAAQEGTVHPPPGVPGGAAASPLPTKASPKLVPSRPPDMSGLRALLAAAWPPPARSRQWGRARSSANVGSGCYLWAAPLCSLRHDPWPGRHWSWVAWRGSPAWTGRRTRRTASSPLRPARSGRS